MACAVELAKGTPTNKFVEFAMSRVRMLLHFGVRPYLVFDGDYLPSKSGTERDRAARRRESKRVGLELLALGRAAEAQAELQKSVDVTPELARQLIEALKIANVDYVVAPYEADSQLVHLERQGHIDGILSEDSDMLVFGAKCLLTKLDQYGDCIVVRRDDFGACTEISLVGWSDSEFRSMAIMSGCDYLPGIEKMGLKTAYRMLRKHKTVERVIRSIQLDGKMKVPSGYLESFRRAESTFLYQWVFCTKSRAIVNLTEPSAGADVSAMEFIGVAAAPHIASQVAVGDLHPHTKLPLHFAKVPSLVARPWARKNDVAPQATLKKHQSIESFFRADRTPLAELDPNSFMPSPSQQRLLAQQQGSEWSAQPTGVVLPQASLRSKIRLQAARRATSDAFPVFSESTTKRQRLCSGEVPLHTLGTASTLTSRFFSSQDPGSPKSRRAAKSSKSSKDRIEIWSDDSVEDALVALEQATSQPLQSSAASADERKSLKLSTSTCTQGTSQTSSARTVDSQDIAAVDRLGLTSFAYDHVSGEDTENVPTVTRHLATGSLERMPASERDAIVPCSSPRAPTSFSQSGSRFMYCNGHSSSGVAKSEPLATSTTAHVGDLNRRTSITRGGAMPKGTEDFLVSESEYEEEDLPLPC